MNDDQKFLDLIEQIRVSTPAKQFSQKIARNKELKNWIMQQTVSCPDIELSERIYLCVHGLSAATCHRGNRKIFNTFVLGYRFCANNCDCRREEQSKKMTAHQASLSSEEKERRTKAQIVTFQTKYGENVTNAMHVPEIAAKVTATCIERYGAASPFQSNEIIAKIKEKNMATLGVEFPLQSSVIQAKAAATFFRSHGTLNKMYFARKAFLDQNNGKQPFELEQYQRKATETMLRKFGVKKALENPFIYQNMVDGIIAKRGVSNVAKDPAVRARMRETNLSRYGRISPNQVHISDEMYAILQDKEKFTELTTKMSIRGLSIMVGMSYDGIRKYYDRYEIERTKSSYEIAMHEFLNQMGIAHIQRDRIIIAKFELDFVLTDFNIGIEICGLYHHSEEIKVDTAKTYHLDKLNRTNQAGYQLLTLFEDEIVKKQSIVETRILHMIGRSEKGYGARKATVRQIKCSVSARFLNKYHIQGSQYGFAYYGAFVGDELIAVMVFGKSVRDKGKIELMRFATDGRNHPGIASKMFRKFINDRNPSEVISYADRRWSFKGGVYLQMGFTLVDNGEPNYWYIHKNRFGRENRMRFMRHKIKHLVANSEDKTEVNIMEELGYYRIWDCGSFKFQWLQKND